MQEKVGSRETEERRPESGDRRWKKSQNPNLKLQGAGRWFTKFPRLSGGGAEECVMEGVVEDKQRAGGREQRAKSKKSEVRRPKSGEGKNHKSQHSFSL